MLSKQFNEISNCAMLRAGILAVMAAITFLYSSFLTGGMVYAVAAYAILNGIMGSMRYLRNKGNEEKRSFNLHLFISSLSILFGILCIIYFRYAVGILPVFLGTLLIAEAVVHFMAILNVKSKLKPVIIIFSTLEAVGGISLIIFTFGFGEIKVLSQMFGSLLALSCVEELLIHLSRQQIIKNTGGATQ